ncbi:MAG: hypothetical protein L3J71_13505 [Victivallaceae bacterium]|nr:hypothetical protein [Victivallaceae bacterium]
MNIYFNDFLRNGDHDWHSTPHSLHGWRVSGRRKVHGCGKGKNYHAGLDYLGLLSLFLEPVLGFLINGEKPEFDKQVWTPSQLEIHYTAGQFKLIISCCTQGNAGVAVKARLINNGDSPQQVTLQVYGEKDQKTDFRTGNDLLKVEKETGKIIDMDNPEISQQDYYGHVRESNYKRVSPQTLVHNVIEYRSDSYRGGYIPSPKDRYVKLHYAKLFGTLAIALPEGSEVKDSSGQWKQDWNFNLAGGMAAALMFRVHADYKARAGREWTTCLGFVQQAEQMRNVNYDELVTLNNEMWQTLLNQIEAPPEDLKPELKKMYYRAWVCIWDLVTPGFDTGRMDGLAFSEAMGLVTKADHRATFPADWETGIVALLISQVDPELAAKIMDNLMVAVEPDGYVPETLVFSVQAMLPMTSTYFMWQIYQKTGNVEWLRKHYQTQKRSFIFHNRHLNFSRRGNPAVRNALYVHIGAIYLDKIAKEIQADKIELEFTEWMIDETYQVVQCFWDEELNQFAEGYNERATDPGGLGYIKVSSMQCMTALFAGATEEQIIHLLNDIKEKYMIGEYGLMEGTAFDALSNFAQAKIAAEAGVLDTVQDNSEDDLDNIDLSKVQQYKHSNYMYFIPGLAKTDPELCRTICMRSIEGIAKNGDFYEQMFCNMDGKAFGPMAAFGAYGLICCVQTLNSIGIE